MSIDHPGRIVAVMCAVLAAAPVRQAVGQVRYPGYGAAPLAFGPGSVVANPHPRDLYNGATVATPGTFMDRFRRPDSTTASVPCDLSGNGTASYGQAGREIRPLQSDRPGLFHDRFANVRRPDLSEPSPDGGPGLNATAGPATGCR